MPHEPSRPALPFVLDRRMLLTLLAGGGVAGALSPLSAAGATLETTSLAAALGLRGGESRWLTELTAGERRELQQALRDGAGEPVTPRTLDLLNRLLGRRSRLYAFVDYPPVADVRSVCDGLLRE